MILDSRQFIGIIYILNGTIGFSLNIATLLMISTNRIYRLSAYVFMANLALADAVMLAIVGVACGYQVLLSSSVNDAALNLSNEMQTIRDLSVAPLNLTHISSGTQRREVNFRYEHEVWFQKNRKLFSMQPNNTENSSESDQKALQAQILSFIEITAWTASICTYAFLGLNRCIAICFYRTKAKAFNRISTALICSTCSWTFGLGTAFIGTIPNSLIVYREDMVTISFLALFGQRSNIFIVLKLVVNLSSIMAQWICSTLVLLKIRSVHKKIRSNNLNANSANRFKKQAGLTFQFFYPSIVCAISSIIYFIKPFMTNFLTLWQFFLLHLIWLVHHMCNPLIYAYFNECMRNSYKNWLNCRSARWYMERYKDRFMDLHGTIRTSRRSGQGTYIHRPKQQHNFVRNSLQLQSRNFEHLCEFMVRVNPMSSEGWAESSNCYEEEEEQISSVKRNLVMDTSFVDSNNIDENC